MNHIRAKHITPILKYTRQMQQFTDFPLIFGNSDFPSSMLYRIEQTLLDEELFKENEVKFLYGDFCKLLSAKQAHMPPEFIDADLFNSIQQSIGNINKAGLKIKCKEIPDFQYRILDHFSVSGPFVLMTELNPKMKFLQQVRFRQYKLNTNVEPYKSVFRHRFSGREQSAWEGLVSKIDFAMLASKVNSKYPLENEDLFDLISFHIYLSSIRPSAQLALVAVKGGSLVTIENRNGEAEDGEEQPYVHLLCLERLKLDKEDDVVAKNFITNKWMISEVDFLTSPDFLKEINKE